MMPEQAVLLQNAHNNVRGARLLANDTLYGIAVSRAYYAMFYIAQALLLGEGMAFSKHTGVIAAFGEYFANTGRVPKALHRILIDAEKLRLKGDYGDERVITAEQAETQIAYAERFLEVAEQMIGPLPPPAMEAR
jgi:uncharacterized protein (UPF0332 family)